MKFIVTDYPKNNHRCPFYDEEHEGICKAENRNIYCWGIEECSNLITLDDYLILKERKE